jgi:hypothetical protein
MSAIQKRAVFAFFIAAILAVPTLFEHPWGNTFAAIAMTIVNFPGILLTGRFFPPEGFPGQSPLHSILMISVQAVCWYLVLSFFFWVTRRRS